MRYLLVILLCWIVHILLMVSLVVLLFISTGLFAEYQGSNKAEVAQSLILNPSNGIKIGIIILIALFFSGAFSATLAGLLARKNGWVIGGIISTILPLLGFFGGIATGRSSLVNIEGVIFLTIIVSFGTLFGYLGEKIGKRKLLNT